MAPVNVCIGNRLVADVLALPMAMFAGARCEPKSPCTFFLLDFSGRKLRLPFLYGLKKEGLK